MLIFVCIKLTVGVNSFKKVNIQLMLKYIFICINFDLIFRSYISVCPVYGAKWNCPESKWIRQKKAKILFLKI